MLGFPPQVFPNHNLLSHMPSICLLAVNSNPHPGIIPQSLNSSSQMLCLSGHLRPYPEYIWLQQGLSASHSNQAATDQLSHSQPKMFLLWLRQLPWHGDRTPASIPPPAKGRSNPTNTPVIPPSYFILLSFVRFYIFFSAGQVLLSTPRWCSACTSVSEGVFLMYPWREMYSMSAYFSSILFSPYFLPFLPEITSSVSSMSSMTAFLLNHPH